MNPNQLRCRCLCLNANHDVDNHQQPACAAMADRLRCIAINSIWALVILSSLTSVQGRLVSSSNDTSLLHNATDLRLTLAMSSGMRFNLEALTRPAMRLSQSINAVPLMIAKPEEHAQDIRTGSIAYMTCESGPWVAADLDIDAAFNLVAGRSPSAIILFSNVSNHCNFTDANNIGFSMIYSMTSADSSRVLESRLLPNDPGNPITASIANITMTQGGSSSTDPNAGTSPFGPQPTTHIVRRYPLSFSSQYILLTGSSGDDHSLLHHRSHHSAVPYHHRHGSHPCSPTSRAIWAS